LKKRWITLLAIIGLLAAVITGGAVMAQETGGEESADPATPAPAATTIMGRVAAILGLEEATVEDAFRQARNGQKTEAYRENLDRKVEQGFITSEEADEQFLWFQSRPDSLTRGFRQGGKRRPGFGHARPFEYRKFGMRMHRRGGQWGGQDSYQQEVVPTEPSTEPDPTSQ
jgi:hypothetical protein